jgi:hypothetical protein
LSTNIADGKTGDKANFWAYRKIVNYLGFLVDFPVGLFYNTVEKI